MKTAKIYAVCEPAGPIRYVGHTTQTVEQRAKLHKTKGSEIGKWMQDHDHTLVVLEECLLDAAHDRERFWIVHCREAGNPLLNRNKFSANYSPVTPGKPRKPMLPEFDALVLRAARLRIVESELAQLADISSVTWWRAKTGVTLMAGRMKVLRHVEAVLDNLEEERTLSI